MVRVGALRRGPLGTALNTPYRFGRFELNPTTRQLAVDGKPVVLGAKAFDVLFALVERRERLVTKDELLELVWPKLVVEENNLQVQVSALRKTLGPKQSQRSRGAATALRLNCRLSVSRRRRPRRADTTCPTR